MKTITSTDGFRCKGNNKARVVIIAVLLGVYLHGFLNFPFLEERMAAAETKTATSSYPLINSTDTSLDDARISNSKQLGTAYQRILLFVTTYASKKHFQFLRKCWPPSIAKSTLLQKADVLIFSSGHNLSVGKTKNISLIERTFPGQNASIHVRENLGYQRGAILALEEALKNGWFNGYDWVIRLNPDVIIRNDTWIRETMNDPNVDGIFVKCSGWNETHDDFTKIHTDFSIFRPTALSASTASQHASFPPLNAESVFTAKVEPILASGRYKFLQGADWSGRVCKVRGKQSPVIHQHDYLRFCREDLTGHSEWS